MKKVKSKDGTGNPFFLLKNGGMDVIGLISCSTTQAQFSQSESAYLNGTAKLYSSLGYIMGNRSINKNQIESIGISFYHKGMCFLQRY